MANEKPIIKSVGVRKRKKRTKQSFLDNENAKPRRKRRTLRTKKTVIRASGERVTIGKSQFRSMRRFQRLARKQGNPFTSQDYYRLVEENGLKGANRELNKRYKAKRLTLTPRQKEIAKKLQQSAKKLGISINTTEILKSKAEFGWGKTRKNIEQAIRHKAGFAYYEYIHYLEKLITDNNLEMPDTLKKLRNKRNYPYMTYDSLEQVHDTIYEVLKGSLSEETADSISVMLIEEGVNIGKEIAKFRV